MLNPGFILFAGISNPVWSQEFHVAGTLEGERLFEKKVTGRIQSTHFDVSLSGCNWLIRIEPGMLGGYVEAGYDGDVVRDVAEGPFKPSASVFNSEVPPAGGDPRIAIVWTAFAQSSYLNKSITSGSLIPAFIRTFSPQGLPATAEGLTEGQMFPSRIIYFATGAYLPENGTTALREPPFENGFTNAIYTVSRFTKIGALRIPVEFELSQYQPSTVRPVSSNDISLCFHCIGKVTTFEPKCAVTNFSPILPNNPSLAVSDMRFITAPRSYLPMFYQTNRWLTKSEVEELADFKTYVQQETILAKIGNPLPKKNQIRVARQTIRHDHSWLVFFGFAVMAALGLAVTWRTLSKTHNQRCT